MIGKHLSSVVRKELEKEKDQYNKLREADPRITPRENVTSENQLGTYDFNSSTAETHNLKAAMPSKLATAQARRRRKKLLPSMKEQELTKKEIEQKSQKLKNQITKNISKETYFNNSIEARLNRQIVKQCCFKTLDVYQLN